jgi:hypothetical protein
MRFILLSWRALVGVSTSARLQKGYLHTFFQFAVQSHRLKRRNIFIRGARPDGEASELRHGDYVHGPIDNGAFEVKERGVAALKFDDSWLAPIRRVEPPELAPDLCPIRLHSFVLPSAAVDQWCRLPNPGSPALIERMLALDLSDVGQLRRWRDRTTPPAVVQRARLGTFLLAGVTGLLRNT